MTKHDEGACCAAPSKEQSRQRLAKDLMYQAVDMLKSQQTAAAETLIRASYLLLDQSGGRKNATGAWLLQMQANIFEQNGELLKAIDFSRKAKETAKELFGRNDAFTCAFMLFYALNLAQAGYARGLTMVEKGIKRLEKASPNDQAPQAWVEHTITDALRVLREEKGLQDPKKACEVFSRLYQSPHNGVYSVELKGKKRGRPAKIEVKVNSWHSISVIAKEHRNEFKGIKVKISVEPIAGMVVLHRAS